MWHSSGDWKRWQACHLHATIRNRERQDVARNHAASFQGAQTLTVIGSLMAPVRRCFAANSRLVLMTRANASLRLRRASARVRPCVFTPGISSIYATYQRPRFSITEVNSCFITYILAESAAVDRTQSGMLPCFLRGLVSRLFSRARRAVMMRERVSAGSMMASM